MTDKELEKKAEEYAKEQEEYCTLGVYDDTAELEYDRGYNIGYINGLEEGFIAGAKEMQEENERLKAQIEKMKCCENCKLRGSECVALEYQGILCGKTRDKWELVE